MRLRINPAAIAEYIDEVGLTDASLITGISVHTFIRMKGGSYDNELQSGTIRKLKKTGRPIETLTLRISEEGNGGDAA